jgi:hypothetical protein
MQTHSLDLESSSSQYASIADASQVGLDLTGNCSFEMWVKFESLPSSGNNMYFIGKWAGSNKSYGVGLNNNAGTYRLIFANASDGNSDVQIYKNLGFTPVVGVWYHFAFAFTASTGTCEYFVNGLSLGTTAGARTSNYNGTASFSIGNINGSEYLDGLIKDVRAFNDVRTVTEIIADAHTEDVSDANLQGEWNFNNAYTDSSGNGNTLTASGSPTFSTNVAWEDPVGVDGSTYLETSLVSYWKLEESSGTREDIHSTNDLTDNNTVTSATGIIDTGADFESTNSEWLSIADGSQSGLDILAELSLSFWVKPEGTSGSNPIGKWQTTGNQRQYRAEISGTAITFQVSTNGTEQAGNTLTVGSLTLSAGTWYHIVLVRSGATMQIYLNGKMVGNASISASGNLYNGTGAFTIGAIATPANYFDGIMDEVAVYSRALHYGDVLDLYDEGTAIPYTGAVSVTANATVLTATFSLPASTVTAIRNATVSPSALSATFSLPASTVTATRSVTQLSSVLSATFSLPSATVTAVRSVTVSPSALTATFSIPASNVITPDAYVAPAVLALTFSTPAPTVTAERHVQVDSTVVSATFSLPAPSVIVAVSVAPATLSATFSLGGSTVEATQSVSVSPSVLAMTFSIPTSSYAVSVSVAPAVLAMTFSIPSSVITTVRNLTVSPDVLAMIMSLPSAFVRGDFWQEKFATASDPWSNKVYNENDNWSNKF